MVSGETHHKTAKTKWRLLEIYYGNKTVLFLLVAGNEVFVLSAYLNAWGEELWGKQGGVWWWGNAILMVVGFVLFAVKKVGCGGFR